MDAPPIPRLVDLVHAFKGVVVEQFKKSRKPPQSFDLLWRLLKLLFKILHQKFRWTRRISFENTSFYLKLYLLSFEKLFLDERSRL